MEFSELTSLTQVFSVIHITTTWKAKKFLLVFCLPDAFTVVNSCTVVSCKLRFTSEALQLHGIFHMAEKRNDGHNLLMIMSGTLSSSANQRETQLCSQRTSPIKRALAQTATQYFQLLTKKLKAHKSHILTYCDKTSQTYSAKYKYTSI